MQELLAAAEIAVRVRPLEVALEESRNQLAEVRCRAAAWHALT